MSDSPSSVSTSEPRMQTVICTCGVVTQGARVPRPDCPLHSAKREPSGCVCVHAWEDHRESGCRTLGCDCSFVPASPTDPQEAAPTRKELATLAAKAVADLIGKEEQREEGWGMWYDLIISSWPNPSAPPPSEQAPIWKELANSYLAIGSVEECSHWKALAHAYAPSATGPISASGSRTGSVSDATPTASSEQGLDVLEVTEAERRFLAEKTRLKSPPSEQALREAPTIGEMLAEFEKVCGPEHDPHICRCREVSRSYIEKHVASLESRIATQDQDSKAPSPEQNT